VVLAVATLAACQKDKTSEGVRVPSEAQARGVLAQYVTVTQTARTARDYCTPSNLGDACERAFERAGGIKAMPTTAPDVAGVRDGGEATTVLVLCGTDAKGNPYRTDFPVHYEKQNGDLFAVIPVFWSGTTFSGQVNPDDPQSVGATAGSGGSANNPTC
jgi:hypothetical protein